jgi:hypothetical protein
MQGRFVAGSKKDSPMLMLCCVHCPVQGGLDAHFAYDGPLGPFVDKQTGKQMVAGEEERCVQKCLGLMHCVAVYQVMTVVPSSHHTASCPVLHIAVHSVGTHSTQRDPAALPTSQGWATGGWPTKAISESNIQKLVSSYIP